MANKKKKIHKISIDRKICIAAATCIIVAPNGFELDSENIAVVRPKAVGLDDDGKQIFPKLV